MSSKRLLLYPLVLLTVLIISLMEESVRYNGQSKTTISILVATIISFICWGWLWFLPLTVFVWDAVYQKWWWRIAIWLAPFCVMFLFYSYLLQAGSEETDHLLYAGYYHRYPYYLDIMLSTFLVIIVGAILIEFRIKRK